MIRRHVLVSGRVHGVWFRVFTRESAQALNVKGWVRNLPDIRVEAIAEGEESAIDAFLTALRQGPPLAEVTNLDVSEEPFTGDFNDFRILD